MITDTVTISNRGTGFTDALEETRKAAVYRGISQKDSVRLQLLTEEMLSMIRTVTGEMEASFRVESDKKEFRLYLTTKTRMDREKREILLASSTTGKNESAKSFLGKVRNAFEEAMASDPDRQDYELPVELQADLTGRNFETDEWDRYEQSVLFRLADQIKIGIRGGEVSMTVVKAVAA